MKLCPFIESSVKVIVGFALSYVPIVVILSIIELSILVSIERGTLR